MPNIDDNSHLPSGVPVTGENELIEIVQVESTDKAPPALLWEDAADASSDPDVFRLDEVEDLPNAA